MHEQKTMRFSPALSLCLLALLGAGCLPAEKQGASSTIPPTENETAYSTTTDTYATTTYRTPALLKLGFIAPLSGERAALGDQARKIVQYEVDRLNKIGGNLEVLYEDGACNSETAVRAFDKLTQQDGVAFVLGGLCSAETLAIAPLAEERGILTLSSASTDPAIDDAGDYTFSLAFRDDRLANGLVAALKPDARVALVSQDDTSNTRQRQYVLAALNARTDRPRPTLVIDKTFTSGETNLDTLFDEVLAAKPNTIILLPRPGEDARVLLAELSERRTNIALYTHNAYLAEESRANTGDVAEGMTIFDVPPPSRATFAERMQRVKETVGDVSALGDYGVAATLDAVDILSHVARQGGSDPAQALDVLRISNFVSNLGVIRFVEGGFPDDRAVGTFIIKDAHPVRPE